MGDDPLANLASFKAQLGDWEKPLKAATETDQFKKLFLYVKKQYETTECYPPKNLIFNAFRTAKFSDLKVVIVG